MPSSAFSILLTLILVLFKPAQAAACYLESRSTRSVGHILVLESNYKSIYAPGLDMVVSAYYNATMAQLGNSVVLGISIQRGDIYRGSFRIAAGELNPKTIEDIEVSPSGTILALRTNDALYIWDNRNAYLNGVPGTPMKPAMLTIQNAYRLPHSTNFVEWLKN